MKAFEIISYNFDEQRFEVRINHPLKNGYFVVKDIDLDTTIYKMKLWDVNPGLGIFFIPTPKHGFDFQRDDFGGFTFELIDEGVSIDGIEADDTITYIANMYEDVCKKMTIVSTDRDFYQLVDDKIQIWSPIKKKMYNTQSVIDEFGVHPNNYVIYNTEFNSP